MDIGELSPLEVQSLLYLDSLLLRNTDETEHNKQEDVTLAKRDVPWPQKKVE